MPVPVHAVSAGEYTDLCVFKPPRALASVRHMTTLKLLSFGGARGRAQRAYRTCRPPRHTSSSDLSAFEHLPRLGE